MKACEKSCSTENNSHYVLLSPRVVFSFAANLSRRAVTWHLAAVGKWRDHRELPGTSIEFEYERGQKDTDLNNFVRRRAEAGGRAQRYI